MGYGDKWRFGCDAEMTIYTPRGRAIKTRCGSTAYDGGVNQCDDCAEKSGPLPLPGDEEGDMEWFDRATGGDDV